MKINILKPNHFCLYKNREVGVAFGCFAGEKFKETSGDEYLNDVMGDSFMWIDNQCNNYKDSKYSMTRPTDAQIINELEQNLHLLEYCVDKGLIELKTGINLSKNTKPERIITPYQTHSKVNKPSSITKRFQEDALDAMDYGE
tara:strand:- start:678 stop:1106 length:429 start_codon:yes stop_codon:yes gene_type:complete